MDWILFGFLAVAGWAMLSVLSGERVRKTQETTLKLAATLAEQVKVKESEIPIARASEGPIGSIGTGAGKQRKAA